MTQTVPAVTTARSAGRTAYGLAAAALLLLGATLLALGLVHGNSGYAWPSSAEVTSDGEVHAVGVDPGVRTMLWTLDYYTTPACTLTDPGDGAVLQQTAAEHGYTAPDGGTAGEWVGTTTFRPMSDRVDVRCTGVAPAAIHTAPPAGPRSFANRAVRVVAAVAIEAIALLASLLAAGFLIDGRRRRRQRRSPSGNARQIGAAVRGRMAP